MARCSRAGRTSPDSCWPGRSTSSNLTPPKSGGLSESRRVAWLAEALGAAFIPHGWNTGVGLAADLHLAAALPHTELVEYKTGSAYIDDLVVGGFRLDGDGLLDVPAGAGLGIELDPQALAKYSPGHGLF